MKRTFTLHKPDGNVTLYFCGGNKRTAEGRMTFNVESPEHVFKFVLPNPTEEDQKLRAKDVEALHPQYVIFRNGRKISRPDFQLCKTEQLPADERMARWGAIQAKTSTAEYKKLNEQIKHLNEDIAALKPGRGKNKKNDKTPSEKRWELKVFNHYTSIHPRMPFEEFAEAFFSDYGLDAEKLEALVRRVRRRIERGTK